MLKCEDKEQHRGVSGLKIDVIMSSYIYAGKENDVQFANFHV
jgi:hypothetical protein